LLFLRCYGLVPVHAVKECGGHADIAPRILVLGNKYRRQTSHPSTVPFQWIEPPEVIEDEAGRVPEPAWEL